MAVRQLTCRCCGVQLPHGKRAYCSPACASKAPRVAESRRAECWACGKTFRPKRMDRLKACSKPCTIKVAAFTSWVARTGGRVKVRAQRGRATKSQPRAGQFEGTCLLCGAPFEKSQKALYCSGRCRVKACLRAKAPPNPRCIICGTEFPPPGTVGRRSVTCSDACDERHQAARSGAKTARRRSKLRSVRAEAVDPIRVFERDGWRCCDCGSRTPSRLRGTYDPRAPELDHIIPLAGGGEHTYRNTRCLCRSCNGRKSDGPGGQLLLFG